VALSASTLETLSQASLSARVAQSLASLTRAVTLSCATTTSRAKASLVCTAVAQAASTAMAPPPPHLDHLLLRCGHTSSAPRQALQKQRQGAIREPKDSQERSGKLSIFFKLTRIGYKISRPTTATISNNSFSMTATCGHACSTLSSTYCKFTGRDGEQGEPNRRNPATLDLWHLGTQGPKLRHPGLCA
jgi:hypothetical protein